MNKVINILLVEDDPLDILDIQRTMGKMNILHRMHIAKNGEEAMAFLEGERKVPSGNYPDLVLLDINMPKMNGLEFLTNVRHQDAWKDLKVFVVTTSEEKVDKAAAAKIGVSGYIVKPLKLSNPSSMDCFHLMIDLMNIKNRI
jgi:CheY-like chemotaxis protein